jgi:serine/threonine-protein kinase
MSPQQSIAHYCITSKLGEGGMGEVWRATDTKLNREVAIKVLPASFGRDAARMARLEREAKARSPRSITRISRRSMESKKARW